MELLPGRGLEMQRAVRVNEVDMAVALAPVNKAGPVPVERALGEGWSKHVTLSIYFA